MYKFLLILLFVFLFADESIMHFQAEGWKMTSIDKELYTEIEKYMDSYLFNEMSILLNPDKFEIKLLLKKRCY